MLIVEPDSTEAKAAASSSPDSEVEEAMTDALATAIKKFEADGADSALHQYFAPRRLGATAPHSCMSWAVDYRANDDDAASKGEGAGADAVRHIGDDGLVEQINRLLNAGLRVPRDGT